MGSLVIVNPARISMLLGMATEKSLPPAVIGGASPGMISPFLDTWMALPWSEIPL